MDFLNRLEQGLIRLEKWVMLVSMAVMLLAVAMQVFFRYVIALSVPWTEELSIITFILIVFYGAALAGYHDRHLGINNLVNRLSGKTFVAVWYIRKAVLVAFLAVVIVGYAIPMAMQGWTNTYTIIKIPLFYVLVQIPVFGVLTAFHSVMSMLRREYRKELAVPGGR